MIELIKIKNSSIDQLDMCDLTVNNIIKSSACEGVCCNQCPYSWINNKVIIGALTREHTSDNPS